MDKIKVNAADLARCFGVSRQAISKMRASGLVSPDADGMYELYAEAQRYIQRLRERGIAAPAGKKQLEEEALRWKIENAKTRNRDWRLQRDREVALAIIQALAGAIGDVRRVLSEGGDPRDKIDNLARAISGVDVDDIACAVDGMEVEDDDIGL